MEQYIVSARKYRPSTFDSVVGQAALTSTLKNAIAGGRLAHAYLFCGGRGVGKTSCARIFAKTINCTNRTPGGEACNECDSCRQFNENRSLNIIELDAASHNGIEDIKSLIDQVLVPPAVGKYRVFIIDEVHMLSTAAFNAFLKTLEEPPVHAIFILATTEKHKIIPTILSRCQVYDFNRISVADMVNHLRYVAQMEGIATEDAALSVIASKADGAMRDALSIFDQVAACTRNNITYQATIENLNMLDRSYYTRLLDAFLSQDVATALLIYKEIRDRGFDSQFFINGLGMYMRDLMAASSPATVKLIEASDTVQQELAEKAAALHPGFIYKAMDLCNQADFNFRTATNKQFLIELTLIKLCQLLSPSPDNEGADEGRLQPLKPVATPSVAAAAAPAVTPEAVGQPAPVSPVEQLRPVGDVHPAGTVRQRSRYSPGSLSLNSMQTGPAETAAVARTPAPEMPVANKAFSLAELEDAWRKISTEFEASPVLYGAMSDARLMLDKDTCITVVVSALLMQSSIKAELNNIRAKLAEELSNGNITLDVIVNEDDENPVYWSNERVLENMVQRHPELGELIRRFGMRPLR